MRKIISEYQNGNYKVVIFDDGTKIRMNKLDSLVPDFPESMDCKISNYCPFGCPQCFVKGTKILMSDYTYKNIEDIQIGDEVIAFDEVIKGRGKRQQMRTAKVLKTFKHVEEDLLKITTDKGNSFICTVNHPIYIQKKTTNGEKKVSRHILCRRADELTTNDILFTMPFPLKQINRNSENYKLGYFLGAWTGDGSVTERIDKWGYDMQKCRFVVKNEAVNDYVFKLSKEFFPDFYQLDFKFTDGSIFKAVTSAKREVFLKMSSMYEKYLGKIDDIDYAVGYLAGIYDTEGHIDQHHHTIRISNTNEIYLNEIKRCLSLLNIDFVEEKKEMKKEYYKQCYNIRILGNNHKWLEFLFLTRPLYDYKGFEHNYQKIKAYDNSQVVSIESITEMQYVYNFETESHTYIANNVFVHNCHEQSSENGEYGKILNNPFIQKLHSGTELAIGGGAVTFHPDLIPFLQELKEKEIIPSITINQQEWEKSKIDYLVNNKLIYGLGVSFVSFNDELWNEILSYPNVVIHLIAGYHSNEVFEYFADKGAKILILGYKNWGRGKQYMEQHKETIPLKIASLEEILPKLFTKCKVVSFDNLAIEQLHIRNVIGEEKWKEFYMGSDGEYTMYVDLVKNQCAKSSTSPDRRPIEDFEKLWQEIKKKE